MINEYINELVAYGLNQGLVDPEDEVYVTNRLLELFQLTLCLAAEFQKEELLKFTAQNQAVKLHWH